MPQDELWGASARLTGWTFGYQLDVKNGEHDLLSVTTHWGKQPPSHRQGNLNAEVPTYMRDYVPQVLTAVHFELTGGLACNVPGVAQAKLLALREGFRQGALQ